MEGPLRGDCWGRERETLDKILPRFFFVHLHRGCRRRRRCCRRRPETLNFHHHWSHFSSMCCFCNAEDKSQNRTFMKNWGGKRGGHKKPRRKMIREKKEWIKKCWNFPRIFKFYLIETIEDGREGRAKKSTQQQWYTFEWKTLVRAIFVSKVWKGLWSLTDVLNGWSCVLFGASKMLYTKLFRYLWTEFHKWIRSWNEGLNRPRPSSGF